MADNKFFTNTYITGRGRRNYLKINHLEEPLYTSFTFDIDLNTSPLFYTINNGDYGYPNITGMGEKIETALKTMYATYMGGVDNGYDILALLSAYFYNGDKLGFGIQQNVFIDKPLYGATEYIYMVDKRNGGDFQNDVRFNDSGFAENGGNTTNGNVGDNSYKLGDSVKDVVNESDKAFEDRKTKQQEEEVNYCKSIIDDENVRKEHDKNRNDMDGFLKEYGSIKEKVKDKDGNTVEYTEDELAKKVDEYKKIKTEFKNFKSSIVNWVNGILSSYVFDANNIYSSNACVQKIFSYNNIDTNKEKYIKELSEQFGEDFRKNGLFEGKSSYVVSFKDLYNDLISYTWNCEGVFGWNPNNNNSFLIDNKSDDEFSVVRESEIIAQHGDKLKQFGLYKDNSINGEIRVVYKGNVPDWVSKSETHLDKFKEDGGNYNGVYKAIKNIMTAKCDATSAFSEDFTSDIIKESEELLINYETALKNIRKTLYGVNGNEPCDKSNPNPDSPYGKYLASKEKYENDAYSQALKTLESLGHSGVGYDIGDSDSDGVDIGDSDYNGGNNDVGDNDNADVGDNDNVDVGDSDNADIGDSDNADIGDSDNADIGDSDSDDDTDDYNDATKADIESGEENKPIIAPRTVLDMLGFISGMKKMIIDYPYIIQSITGLDTAYKKNYGIKDPYLGSGDEKIVLTCLESLDLRVSSMFNRYFNAVYDRQYRRERVPVNLRRFNCTVYVHDVRNFVSKNRGAYSNKIIELTDMYYSAIEFRFYDCEIDPEETGNIFNDISNETPSEMKKTNFAFTYGNCIVNFIPASEVSAYRNI